MANTEWENREQRKGFHDRISWTSGWISGYLTRNPQDGKKNYFGGECTCNKFVNCHDCRDAFSYKEQDVKELGVLRNILALQKESDGEIRQAERGKVLSKFADLIHNESVRLSPAMVDMVYSYRVAQIIVELREGKDGE